MINNSYIEDHRRVLIFDFDGVVVHTEHVHFESWNATFQETYGVKLPGDYTQIVGLTLQELMESWTATGLLPVEIKRTDVQEQLLKRKTEHFFEIGKTMLAPVEGVEVLVQHAHSAGWYTAIASRAHRMRLLRTLEIAKIAAVFELILTADHIVDPTTDRKDHSRAAHALGAQPANCIIIEDSVGGIRMPRNSGIGRIIGFTSSISSTALMKAGADEVVDSLLDIHLGDGSG